MAAVANCLLGVFAGLLLKNDQVPGQRKVYWLLGSGAVSLALGFAWAREFPIIKLLWTSTYVLVACGYSAILLGVFYQVVELWRLPAMGAALRLDRDERHHDLPGGEPGELSPPGRALRGRRHRSRSGWLDTDLVSALVTLALAFWLVNFLLPEERVPAPAG